MWRRKDPRSQRDQPQAAMCERLTESRISGQYLMIQRYYFIKSVDCFSLFLHCKFLFLPLLQVKNPTSKTVPIVITAFVVMVLSVAAGVMFVKKYVCGGRSVYPWACVYHLSTGIHFTSNLTGFWLCLQVLGTQVLCAAAARGGQCCWGWDGWSTGDQPHSQWQDWVPWWLRRGVVHLLFSLYKQKH